ncbi:acetyltransferase, gnat family [Metarhizium acridum CQMa 102]|uniref:Acetyltransferase, gnat family n=1 Tax=Metarhizium acridum (strain CQMa 102) TaxID=655827 RepID=E9EBW2_METAQ|nr:acetyltransferase, gnat family [Metarhizium acridum CQMa 102]EFY86582.1 acetyltransferase, gnat family [Metarhizium acridum CQMa 102]
MQNERVAMESRPASELSNSQIADLFNKSFEDYMGSLVNFTAESISNYIILKHVSTAHSHAFYSSDNPNEPIGFAFIAIRPDKPTETRLGAMGIVKASRGKGVGPKALKMVFDAERARGMSTVGFECIQQNAPALKMYANAGCIITRELLGWQYTPHQAEFPADSELKPCSFEEVDVLVKTHGAADLPWQAWGFDKSPETNRAFRLGDAYCVVTDPEDKEKDTVKLACLIAAPQSRRKGEATRLVKAMMGRFPGKKWMAPPIFPKEYGEELANKLGFQKTKLTQYQLGMALN